MCEGFVGCHGYIIKPKLDYMILVLFIASYKKSLGMSFIWKLLNHPFINGNCFAGRLPPVTLRVRDGLVLFRCTKVSESPDPTERV